MIDTLFSTIAPHRCSACGENGTILCEGCKYDIVSDLFSNCVLCVLPCGVRGICPRCVQSTGIQQAWCVGERRDGLKKLLDVYKFDSGRAAAGVGVELFDEIIPRLPPGTAVVGIPSTPRTMRIRGFDHIDRLASGLAKKRGLPRAYPLKRVSNVTLHFLARNERRRLAPSLFRLSGEKVPENILLLDDIVTTGTTLMAAVKVLRAGGAKCIYVAVLARQPLDG